MKTNIQLIILGSCLLVATMAVQESVRSKLGEVGLSTLQDDTVACENSCG